MSPLHSVDDHKDNHNRLSIKLSIYYQLGRRSDVTTVANYSALQLRVLRMLHCTV